MGKRLSSIYKLSFILLILVITYNEYVVYTINSWSWAKLTCKNETNCVKILLVADPQLIGEKNEIYHVITPISVWDSDRFLEKTYSTVVNHLKPDVIVFLGDLFDEGSIANHEQFSRYLTRFFDVFTTGFPIIHIWLPGDNDIGGETDMVTDQKVRRFEEAFLQPSVIHVKHIKFSKVNRMLPDAPQSFAYANIKDDHLSVVLSHMPLILIPGLYVDKALDILKPRLIFSAHEHKSKLVQTNHLQQHRKIIDLSAHDNKIYEYQLTKNDIHEIIIPTCSYRMGTRNVGYGGGKIEYDDTMQYTVFWSPNRFAYLHIYLYTMVLIMLLILIRPVFKIITRPQRIHGAKINFHYKLLKNGV
ncbi:Metallophosphoesterase [Carabus blaptoides fortunei]